VAQQRRFIKKSFDEIVSGTRPTPQSPRRTSVHAHGKKAEAGGAAIHHQNLAAGLMAQAARANLGKNNSVTTTVNLAPMRPSSQRAPSDSVVEKADDFWNKAFLDPLFGKGYPQSVMPLVFPYIQNGDDKQITFTPDAIGVN